MKQLALALLLLAPCVSAQQEPNALMAGIWPDRIVFFDQTTEEFTDGPRLRGASTNAGYTPDRKLFFFVTDRMEAVQVVDPVRREVVDTIKLSTPEKRIRFSSVSPSNDGKKVYLLVNVVGLEVDRFIQDRDVDVMVYDREKREVVDGFKWPKGINAGRRTEIYTSPDGKSLYVISGDIYELDAETREITDKTVLSKPLLAGYGELRGLRLTQSEPGVFYGLYSTEDPLMKKPVFGVAKLDLYNKNVSTFELGPELNLGQFALSPDKKRGYAGLSDLVVIDMETQKVVLKKERFERGRTNYSMIVSHDGTKLYVSGVGDTVWIYDAATLQLVKKVFAGGDFTLALYEIPSQAATSPAR